MEQTLVIIKPGAVQRDLIGEIITRFEKRGFKIIALKMIKIDRPLAEKHYAEHKGKDFYKSLIDIITSNPSTVMVLKGESAVRLVRTMCGATNPAEAGPGTIRGDYGMRIDQNLIHASDSLESAGREIELFFDEQEIVNYELAAAPWI